MPYLTPRMPLDAAVWTNGSPPPAPPRIASIPCQLKGPTHHGTYERVFAFPGSFIWYALVPKESDIRDQFNTGGADRMEIPAGSGRYYQVAWVDDIAKGFPNEYRLVLVYKLGTWPTPTP